MFILLEGSLAARAWLESAEVVGGSFAKGIFASALPMIDQSVLPAVGQARLQRFWSMILAFAVLAFISLTPASAAVPERNVYYTYDVMGRQLTAKFGLR